MFLSVEGMSKKKIAKKLKKTLDKNDKLAIINLLTNQKDDKICLTILLK